MATKGVQEGRARAGSAWRKLEEGHVLVKVGSSMNRPHKEIGGTDPFSCSRSSASAARCRTYANAKVLMGGDGSFS